MIKKDTIEKIASLARIRLSEQEKESLSADLSKIIDYIEQLSEVDTSKVDFDLSETHPINQVREDRAEDFSGQDEILLQAPCRKDNYFEVKGVFED